MQISIFKVVTATVKFSTAEWNELQFFNTPLFGGHSSLWFFYALNIYLKTSTVLFQSRTRNIFAEQLLNKPLEFNIDLYGTGQYIQPAS